MKVLVTILLILGATFALLPPEVTMLPDSEVNSPEFYETLGFFAPELKHPGKAGQVTLGMDTSSFWFFESEDGNKDAPVILVLAMGPTISSFVDLANGLGPFKSIVNWHSREQWWVDNAHSLAMKADVVFIDMMEKGGYSRFKTTKGKSVDEQNMVYFRHITHILTNQLSIKKENHKKGLNLHGTGYTTKFFPGLYNLLVDDGHKVNGLSISNPLFAPYYDMKGAYLFGANNNIIGDDVLSSQEKLLDFLPILSKAKGAQSSSDYTKLLQILYGSGKPYKPTNMLDLTDTCIAYHNACLRLEYTRTVFMNNPRFQLVSKIYKTKFEVIDLAFSVNPYSVDLFKIDNTQEWIKLLNDGVKVLVTAGEYNSFASWYGTLTALTNFNWKHRSLFQNQNPNKFKQGFAKGAENLGFIKFDAAGFFISENRADELVDAIYENLLDIETKSK